MDSRDREAIEGLFDRLQQAERLAPPRDPEAEAFIRSEIARQPAAPYYMAQTILVQQRALEEAERRMEELEQELGLDPAERHARARGGPWQRRSVPATTRAGYGGYGGGGFLAGAAQTALGVAGGVLLADMIGSMFGAGAAQAAEFDPAAEADPADAADVGGDAGSDFGGGDFGGDFGDFGDF
jgi:hypothetical protein